MQHEAERYTRQAVNKLLSVLPEIEDLKIQVGRLEKEKEELRASLELTQAEVEGLKEQPRRR